MYGRIVLDVAGEEFDERFEEAQAPVGRRQPTPTIPAARAGRAWPTTSRRIVEQHTGQPFPQDPNDQLRGAIEAVFRSWDGARAVAYRVRERIAHDLGTAVNVQAMVFGNRDDNSGTGVGFTRDPATGEAGSYGDFLVNAQGEDVVAGIRNTEPLSDAEDDRFPDDLRRAAGHLRPPRAPLPRHVRHRVHHRAGQALDAPDPGRQAHRRRRPAHGRRHDHRRAHEAHPGGGGPCGSPPTTSSSVLHPQFAKTDAQVIATGLAASPGAAVGTAYFTADDAADAAERGEDVILVRTETSPEDVHGMIVAEGILTVAGRAGEPRRRRRPGMGQAGGGRRRGDPDQRQAASPPAGSTVNEGDVISVDGTTGTGDAGRGRGRPWPSRPAEFDDHPELGRRDPGGQDGRAGQRRHRPRRGQRPPVRGRGHRPVPHRAHVPGRGPPARSCGA